MEQNLGKSSRTFSLCELIQSLQCLKYENKSNCDAQFFCSGGLLHFSFVGHYTNSSDTMSCVEIMIICGCCPLGSSVCDCQKVWAMMVFKHIILLRKEFVSLSFSAFFYFTNNYTTTQISRFCEKQVSAESKWSRIRTIPIVKSFLMLHC